MILSTYISSEIINIKVSEMIYIFLLEQFEGLKKGRGTFFSRQSPKN